MRDKRKIECWPKVVLLASRTARFSRSMLHGIARYARLHGFWLMEVVELELHTERHLRWLTKWQGDGVIGLFEDEKLRRLIEGLNIPVVALFSTMPEQLEVDFKQIVVDSAAVGRMAAEFFLKKKLRHFGFCGHSDIEWSLIRRNTFRQLIERAGYEVSLYEETLARATRDNSTMSIHWGWHDHTRQGLQQKDMLKWLANMPKPVGIFACRDEMGRYVIDACRRSGFSVPDDVAVLGVDDDDLVCELTNPPLSSIVLNTERVGYKAAALLDRLMAGEQVDHSPLLVRPVRIVARQSTDILNIEDQSVRDAVHYIRLKSASPIQTRDVVDQTYVLRRTLERRFKVYMGHSIHVEVERSRMAWVEKMLLETDLPLEKIAITGGFSSSSYMARIFHKVIGVTPLAYRRSFREKPDYVHLL